MTDHNQALLFAEIARAVYGKVPLDPAHGFSLDPRFKPIDHEEFLPHRFTDGGAVVTRSETGFSARAYSDGNGQYVIAFAGVNGIQDWALNTQLGAGQYEDSAPIIEEYIRTISSVDPFARFHFVGHSLGGALAQYAAYHHQTLIANDEALERTSTNVVTFNSLGGIDGLKSPSLLGFQRFDPALAAEITAAHYVTDGDFVPRLGGGHLGGNLFVFPNLSDPDQRSFGLVNGHSIDTFLTISEFAESVATIVDNDLHVNRLQITNLQQVAGYIALIGNHFASNGNEVSKVEAVSRLTTAVGAILALTTAAQKDSEQASEPSFSGVIAGELHTLLEAVIDSVEQQLIDPRLDESDQRLELAVVAAFRTALFSDSLAGRFADVALIATALNVSAASLVVTAIDDIVFDEVSESLFQTDLLPSNARSLIEGVMSSGNDALRSFIDRGSSVTSILKAFVGAPPADVQFKTPLSHLDPGATISLVVEVAEAAGPHGRLLLAKTSGDGLRGLSGDVINVNLSDNRFLVYVPPGEKTAAINVTASDSLDGAPSLVSIQVGPEPFEELDAGAVVGYHNVSVIRINGDVANTGGDLIGTEFDDQGSHGPTPALVGSAAADRIIGLGGDDDLFGGIGNDVLIGGPGQDFASGGPGNDVLLGEDRDMLSGDDGHDQIEGAGLLAGGLGNDILRGTGFASSLSGGPGDDLITGSRGADLISADGHLITSNRDWDITFRNAAVNQGLRRLDLRGLYGELVPAEMSGDDAVYARDGDDLVFGGLGNDTLSGDRGNDEIEGNGGDDVVLGGDGDDWLFGDTNLDDSVVGNDLLRGGEGADLIAGGPGRDRIWGDADDDFLLGDMDSRTPNVGDDDVLYGNAGDDQLEGGAGSDTLDGGPGADIIFGDHVQANKNYHGSDQILGQDGDDRIYGVGLADFILGGPGNDQIAGDQGDGELLPTIRDIFGAPTGFDLTLSGDDVIDGGDGDDLIVGDGGSDFLLGSAGNDVIRGGSGHDILHGNDGDDVLSGDEGNDFLAGHAGNDIINPGAGNDVVHYTLGDGHDRITRSATSADFDTLSIHGIGNFNEIGVSINESDLTYRFDEKNSLVIEAFSTSFDLIYVDQSVLKPIHFTTPEVAKPILRFAFDTQEIAGEEANGVLDLSGVINAQVRGSSNDDLYILDHHQTLRIDDPGGLNTFVFPTDLQITDLSGQLGNDSTLSLQLGSLQIEIPAWRGQIQNFVFEDRGIVGFSAIEPYINHAPQLIRPPNPVGAVTGADFSIQLPDVFFDREGTSALTYKVTLEGGYTLPNWINFNSETRTLSGNSGDHLASTANTTINLKIRAEDDASLYAESPLEFVFSPPTEGELSFELEDLNSHRGHWLQPQNPWNIAVRGHSAGDLNNDGYDDFVVHREQGRASLHFGGHDFDPSTANISFTGLVDEEFYSPTTQSIFTGDFNGDGVDDLLFDNVVGAKRWIANSTILLGSESLERDTLQSEPIDLRDRDIPSLLHIEGRASFVGDFNNDGFDDLRVGNRWLLGFDPVPNQNVNPNWIDLNPTTAIDGPATNTFAIGDFNGDAFTDFALADGGGVIYGHASGYPNLDLLAHDTTQVDLSFSGSISDIAHAGDVNGDGLADVVIGSAQFNTAHVIYGRNENRGGSIALDALDTRDGFSISLAQYSVTQGYLDLGFGATVSGIGDINGDGFDDIGVGSSPYATTDRTSKIAIVFGSRVTPTENLTAADLGGQNGLLLPIPVMAGLPSNKMIAPAGDLNADGFSDVVVTSTEYPASSYLFYGANFGRSDRPARITVEPNDDESTLFGSDRANLLRGGSGDNLIFGGPADDLILGGQDNDTLIGGVGDDVLIGTRGHDRYFGGHGNNQYYDVQGNDRYVIDWEAASNLIFDRDGDDVLRFEGDFAPSDLVATYDNQDLVIRSRRNNASVTVGRWRTEDRYKIERFEINDRYIASASAMDRLAGTLGHRLEPDFQLTANSFLPADVLAAMELTWALA